MVEIKAVERISCYSLAVYILFLVGVLLACHQKLKRRGKQEKKKKNDNTPKEETNNENSETDESYKTNGIRKRVRNSYRVNESKVESDMGVFQSKPTVYNDSKNSEIIEILKKPSITTHDDIKFLDDVVSSAKQSKDELIPDSQISLQQKELRNKVLMTNYDSSNSELLSQTSDDNNVDLTNTYSNTRNDTNSKKLLLTDYNNVIADKKEVNRSVSVKVHSDRETTQNTPKVKEEGTSMPSFCNTRIELSIKPQTDALFKGEAEYITIEEKTVSEQYEDGTEIIRTIVTEMPDQRSTVPETVQMNLKNNKYPNKEMDIKAGGNNCNMSNFAEEISLSILSSAFQGSTESIADSDNGEQRKVQIKNECDLSEFRLFIFSKYAERLLKNILQTSYDDSVHVMKETIFSKVHSSSMVDNIVNDIISESVKTKGQNGFVEHKTNNSSENNVTVQNSNKLQCINLFADGVASSVLDNGLHSPSNKNEKQSKNEKINGISTNVSVTVLRKVYEEFDKTKTAEERPVQNGYHSDADTDSISIADEKQPCEVEESSKLPTILLTNAINKELTLTVVDGKMKLDTDANQNLIPNGVVRRQGKVVTDRPLSGYAEKLAELLANEDELDFLDSDEELNESLEKIKSNFGPQRRVSVEVNHLQRQFSVDEINDYSGKNFKSKVDVKRRDKNNKFKGDRPMSLFAQDMLADLLNDDDEDTFTDESETDDEDSDDEEGVLEDEILPVKEAAVLLENAIPFAPISRNFSITSEYELAMDEVTRGYRINSVPSRSSGKPPSLRKAVVIDAGCGVLKAGLCGDTKPTCYCPSVIGVPRRFSQDVNKMKKAYYVGDEAWSMAGMLQIEHPIKQNINNWPDVTNMMEYVLEHELKVNDNEHPIMLTEMGLTSNKNREKLTEVMFETFGVPAFYLSDQASLAMYSMGLTSGLCLNSGFYNTQAVPIYEGHSLPYGTTQLDIGGDQVTTYLGRMIMGNQGQNFSSSSEKLVLNSMKQSLCYIADDAAKEQEKYKTNAGMHQMFTLPDGREIEIGAERCIAGEILFDPNLLGLHQPNTAECIKQSIDRLDVDLHPLMSNVLVTGGNSKLSGFGARLEKELALLYDSKDKINVIYADDPILATWIGGSILSSISVFRDQWITIDQYAEQGAKNVHRVCF